MTGPYFVDANVLVYSSDARDAEKRARANAWLDQLWSRQTGRVSAQVISESYTTLKRLGGAPDEIWEKVARYFAWKPQAVDDEVLRRAHELERRHRLSWWDSTIVAAAQIQNCEVLLTEDLHDGAAFGTLVVRSPFTLELRQPAAAYELHRARGRPRKTASA
jgi:predicted nucleic acid-binding protein